MRWLLLLGLVAACDVNDGHNVDAAPVCIDCDRLAEDASDDANGNLSIYPDRPGGQQGCVTGQKATWVVIQDVPERLGTLSCVPDDGTVPGGGACVWGPTGDTTGYDNCVAGFVCSQGVCVDVCYTFAVPGSLGACESGSCTIDPLLFRNGDDDAVYGVCR
jgi:hypothetical protein